MYPLWEKLVAPLLAASGARRLVEIGALRGQTTVKMLDDLGPEFELHVIDPLPQFDPSEHERRFPGRYHFHRATSLEALPTLPPVDAALLDGDHNWYTVHNELRLLAETADEAGRPLPLIVMHDVGWPYGRRDLYYEPERIPEEFRQPYAKLGLRRGRRKVLDRGGINAEMNNALREGGPRNGVMTALDDFAAERPEELRIVVVPIYFGLAIVASPERLDGHPDLVARLELVDQPEFMRELLELAERLRTEEMQWGQDVFYGLTKRLERGAVRYLELLLADLDPEPIDHLRRCLDSIRGERVDGDLVDCGTPGAGGVLLRGFLEAHELTGSQLWLCGDGANVAAKRDALSAAGLLDDRVAPLPGELPGALADGAPEKVALLRVGADAEARPAAALEAFYDRVAVGGFVVVDGYHDAGCRAAIDGFREGRGIEGEPESEDGSGAWWQKV